MLIYLTLTRLKVIFYNHVNDIQHLFKSPTVQCSLLSTGIHFTGLSKILNAGKTWN